MAMRLELGGIAIEVVWNDFITTPEQLIAYVDDFNTPTVGAYFGEVVRRMFPCRWRMNSENPMKWTIEFEYVPLRFSPVGAAAEALVEVVFLCSIMTQHQNS